MLQNIIYLCFLLKYCPSTKQLEKRGAAGTLLEYKGRWCCRRGLGPFAPGHRVINLYLSAFSGHTSLQKEPYQDDMEQPEKLCAYTLCIFTRRISVNVGIA